MRCRWRNKRSRGGADRLGGTLGTGLTKVMQSRCGGKESPGGAQETQEPRRETDAEVGETHKTKIRVDGNNRTMTPSSCFVCHFSICAVSIYVRLTSRSKEAVYC